MEKIKTLSIDLETYSDIDLSKSGVYRYVESPAFEILLFGVSVNGGDVVVYDLAQGEKIPEEILSALTDNSVIKWAFNAAFERVCLSKYFGLSIGEYLDSQSWRCSMVWSAYMGLPLSLAGAGAVLGLPEQKLKEGKELIKYFCVPCTPTKANGGRTRNLPIHAPEKWAQFKAYNKRDVEVEMSIQDKLRKFPVLDFVWGELVPYGAKRRDPQDGKVYTPIHEQGVTLYEPHYPHLVPSEYKLVEDSSGGDVGDDTVLRWADLEDGHTFNVGDRFSDDGKTYEVLRQFFKADSYRPPALIGDFYQLAE
mgnify:CR=1 FL=1